MDNGVSTSEVEFDVIDEDEIRRANYRKWSKKSREKKKFQKFIDLANTECDPFGIIRETMEQKLATKQFRNTLMTLEVNTCFICNERWPEMNVKDFVCERCRKDKSYPKAFSRENFMDPCSRPAELTGLTMLEELIIARCNSVFTCWRLNGGDMCYSGHCINFPQDINEIAVVLPRLPKELSILTIRRTYSDSHSDFRVRRNKIWEALLWLKRHNKYYYDIEICEERLGMLPEDGNLMDLLPRIDEKTEEELNDEARKNSCSGGFNVNLEKVKRCKVNDCRNVVFDCGESERGDKGHKVVEYCCDHISNETENEEMDEGDEEYHIEKNNKNNKVVDDFECGGEDQEMNEVCAEDVFDEFVEGIVAGSSDADCNVSECDIELVNQSMSMCRIEGASNYIQSDGCDGGVNYDEQVNIMSNEEQYIQYVEDDNDDEEVLIQCEAVIDSNSVGENEVASCDDPVLNCGVEVCDDVSEIVRNSQAPLESSSGFLSEKVIDQEKFIESTLKEFEETNVLKWPPVGLEPVNEFSAHGLFTCAFPTLFPYGNCEPNTNRPVPVTLHEYAEHLMKYKDGRFSTHQSFKYYLLNKIMRFDANNKGSLYYKNNQNQVGATVTQLKEKIEKGELKDLAKNIVYFGGKQRGSPAFWLEQKRKLESMVEQLNLPTYFMTLSCADHLWPESKRLVEEVAGHEVNSLIPYSLVKTWLFQKRTEMFVKKILPTIFPVTDFWYRTEWQARGAPHIHGMLWVEDSPDLSQDFNLSDVQMKIQNYFEQFLCTELFADEKETLKRVNELNPLTKDPRFITNVFDDYNEVAVTTQRHYVCGKYCLRLDKKSKKLVCRFGYPKKEQEDTILEKINNTWCLSTRRNDPLLNVHNVDVLRIWRANCDLKPVLNKDAVIQYLMKYITKAEHLSFKSADYFDNILRNANDSKKPNSVFTKLLMKLIGQRDYTSSEVCHLLLQLPLYKCSRTFVDLKIYKDKEYSLLGACERPTVFASYLKQYRNRPTGIEDMSFLEYVKTYTRVVDEKKTKVPSLRRAVPVVVCYPYISAVGLPENYCERYLLLNKAHRVEGDLKSECDTYSEAYSNFIGVHGIGDRVDLSCDVDGEDEEDNPPVSEPNKCIAQWMAAASICPSESTVNKNDLGERPFDLNVDWAASSGRIEELKRAEESMKKMKQDLFRGNASRQNIVFDVDQLKAINSIKEHIMKNDGSQLLTVIQGLAGSGKTAVIREIEQIIKDLLGEESVAVTAPTGAAASNISGQTIHSLIMYKLVNGNLKTLSGEELRKLQKRLADIKYIIIDEFSLIGQFMLWVLDQRLRQAFPSKSHLPFGGVTIIMVGDLGQLPCVKDRPLYLDAGSNKTRNWAGSNLFSLFVNTYELKKIHRQDEQSGEFKEVLSRLRDGMTTYEDWKFLSKRHVSNVSYEEFSRFENASRIFSTNAQCEEYNYERLEAEGERVAKIVAEDTGNVADYDGNLEKILRISAGSLVVLRKNLWVGAGLVNGAVGVVEDIVYDENMCPPALPKYVVVRFFNYTGPDVIEGSRAVPIAVDSQTFKSKGGQGGRRIQFPLSLAYALTIHKSQGMTLPMVVADFGVKEFASGLTYVGLSRVRNVSDILITGDFSFERLKKILALVKTRVEYENKMRAFMDG